MNVEAKTIVSPNANAIVSRIDPVVRISFSYPVDLLSLHRQISSLAESVECLFSLMDFEPSLTD